MPLFDELNQDVKNQVKGILFLSLSALTITGLLFTEQTGQFGKFLNNFLRLIAGDVAFILPVVITIIGFKMMLPQQIKYLRLRLFGVLLFLFILMIAAHLNLIMEHYEQINLNEASLLETALQLGIKGKGGGILGAGFAIALYFFFKDIGSYIVLGTLALISFLLITNLSITAMLNSSVKLVVLVGKLLKGTFAIFKGGYNYFFNRSINQNKLSVPNKDEVAVTEESFLQEKTFLEKEIISSESTAGNMNSVTNFPEQGYQKSFSTLKTVESKELQETESVNKNGTVFKSDTESDYFLPPLSILPQRKGLQDNKQKRTIAERGRVIEKTLSSFGVQAKISAIHIGPTVTRYEIQPEIGVKVSKIVNLNNDLALNLAASGVRIEAPIPGKAAVGIEVPNKVISLVYLRETLESGDFQNDASPLTMALGKDITGNPVIADLQRMPHLLIAGATGSGKSVCINTIIASILFKAKPQTVKFLMIDPKVVELNIFNGIPHLITPVINEPKRAALALRNILKEMNRRYHLFAQESVRDVSSYNQLILEKKSGEYLPYYVVIIDELADLMMVAASDVEDAIARLAQMARAAGIHLIIATQRPSVDVITGVIKANITSRIAFAVSSHIDSRTILDEGGAEKLLGRGDMLFHPVGAPKPFRVQGAYIAEADLQALIAYIQSQENTKCDEKSLSASITFEDLSEDDELFLKAVNLVFETGQASISILQRKLRIGYTRAARMIDDMEEKGIVGKFEGSRAREVLITPEQLPEILEKINKTQD